MSMLNGEKCELRCYYTRPRSGAMYVRSVRVKSLEEAIARVTRRKLGVDDGDLPKNYKPFNIVLKEYKDGKVVRHLVMPVSNNTIGPVEDITRSKQ